MVKAQMDKAQALYNFWSSFGLNAYDEYTVPDDAKMPYITYETITDSFDRPYPLTASLWYHDTMWTRIEEKTQEISDYLGQGGVLVPYTDGALWVTRRSPFAQRLEEPDDDGTRRIYISISAEYLSAN